MRSPHLATNSSDGERGFSLVEVLVAGAIITLMALTGLAACKALALVTVAGYTAGADAAAIDTQAAQLRDDAVSAFAVFVPAIDMKGAANSVDGLAHEVDFYAKADGGQDVFWRYSYDPAAHTLQRFDYDAGGARGIRDSTTGRIERQAAYPPLRGVMAFGARTVAADQLGDRSRNLYAGLATLLGSPQPFSVSYDHAGLDVPELTGGNAIVQITIANAAASRVVHLAPGSMPSGFTVTGVPRWHAIVFRVDQTHRSGFGTIGKSHVFINARVEVSYDDWTTKVPWCTFNLLGDPGGGLDGGDPHANYTPNEPFEQAEALLADCRRVHPTPPPRSGGNPPEPGVAMPLPAVPPPPCWSRPGPRGRCWPAEAPPDWAPPSPLPIDTPPPEWCAAHAESVACSPAHPANAPAGPG